MNILTELYQMTKKIFDFLQIPPKNTERESYIQTLNKLLDEREEIISKLPNPIVGNQQMKDDIIHFSREIDLLLEKYYNHIKLDLKNVRNQKKAMSGYNKTVTGDGMFFDKRK